MHIPKVAVVGVRGFASMYLRNFARLQDAGKIRWMGAVVRSPQKAVDEVAMLETRGVKIYPNTEALYQNVPDLDLVGLPVGIEFHRDMTIEALNHGCNVLVEKPASTTTDCVDDMIAVADSHPNQFVAVGFQHMADRNLWYIKNIIHSGKLGAIKRICVHGVWPRADAYYGRNNWAGKICAGNGFLILDSPANNAFAHYLNIALFMATAEFASTAKPTLLKSRIFRARKTIETFDSCAIQFMADDIPVTAFLTHTALKASEPKFRIDCENGSVLWQMDATWSISIADGEVLASGKTGYSYEDMFNDVVRKVNDKKHFACDLRMARNQADLIEKIYRECKVEDVPENILHRREEDGQFFVDGILEFGEKCFKTGMIPEFF